jgi:hypothetical protein
MKQRLKTSTAAEKTVILGLRNNVNFTHISLHIFVELSANNQQSIAKLK